MEPERLETIVRILGAVVSVCVFGASLVGAYLAGRRGTSRLSERVGALEREVKAAKEQMRRDVDYFKGRVDEMRDVHKRNIPELWANRDDHERRIADLETWRCVTKAASGKETS